MTFTVCELENGPVEIVDLPSYNMVDLSIVTLRNGLPEVKPFPMNRDGDEVGIILFFQIESEGKSPCLMGTSAT